MKIRAALRYTLTILAVTPFLLTPVGAEAKPKASKAAAEATPVKKKSLALAPFEGKKNAEVRGWIRDALQSGFEVTDAEEFKVKADAAAYAKMGADLGVDAVAVGKVEKTKFTLTIYQSSDGRVLIALQFKASPGPKLKTIIDKRMVPKLYAAFGMETPEEAARKRAEAKQIAEEEAGEDEGSEEEADEKPKKKKAADEETSAEEEGEAPKGDDEASGDGEKEDSAAAGPTGAIGKPFDIRGGLHFSKRSFAFNDTLSQLYPDRLVQRPLRDYNGGLDLAVFARLELYPGALLGADGLASNLGLIGGFSYGIPSTTVYRPSDGSAPKNLTSQVHEWYFGARGRLPLGAKAGLGLTASYGQQRYFLKGDEVGALVPDIQYRYLRFGPDFWVDAGKLSLEAFVGARLVLGTGELERGDLWFAQVGSRGLDAGLVLSYAVTSKVSVMVGGDYKRYGFNFNPIKPGALYVAGGATDQYVGGWIGAGFHLPGSPAK
ncbi:MAG: hypothetical protein ACOY0T_40800 [Myxococcota bacterium]